MHGTAALTSMCVALLGVTRTGRYRAAANARENLIVAKRDQFLHTQRKAGQEKELDYHSMSTNDLLNCAK